MNSMNPFSLLLASLVLLAQPLPAGSAQKIHHQGQLADVSGQPLDGAHDLTFRLYSTAAGDTLVWQETHPAAQVSDGHFSVLLGRYIPLEDTVDWSKALWLSVQVDQEDEQFPYQQIASVPHAITAEKLADPNSLLGPIHVEKDKVGIGTNQPLSTLHVSGEAKHVDLRLQNTQNRGRTYGLRATDDGHLIIGDASARAARISIGPSGSIGINTARAIGKYALQVGKPQKPGNVLGQYLVSINPNHQKNQIHLARDDYKQLLTQLNNMTLLRFHYKQEQAEDKLHLGLSATDAPNDIVTSDGKHVNLYEYITFLAGVVKAQQAQIQNLKQKVDAL